MSDGLNRRTPLGVIGASAAGLAGRKHLQAEGTTTGESHPRLPSNRPRKCRRTGGRLCWVRDRDASVERRDGQDALTIETDYGTLEVYSVGENWYST